MDDIETLVRESLRYDGGLHPLSAEPLARRARRRRLRRRATTAAGVIGVGAAAWVVWPQQHEQVTAIEPAAPSVRPSSVDLPTVLKSTDRITTAEGAVIDVSPDRLCVGNTEDRPGCLLGANPALDNSSTAYGWTTPGATNFVYAWLAPSTSTQATLQVGDAAAVQADLYRVEGRDLLIAVVTGHPCWTAGEVATELATDAAGAVVYEHENTDGTCD